MNVKHWKQKQTERPLGDIDLKVLWQDSNIGQKLCDENKYGTFVVCYLNVCTRGMMASRYVIQAA